MNQYIEGIKSRIEPLREEIINHKAYDVITDLEGLRAFMETHVYAVWDFMSLLKALQNNLTCVTIPWVPKGSGETRYLINEIVLGEESDVDMAGQRISHFELYLSAMQQSGADTAEIERFIGSFLAVKNLQQAFEASRTPSHVQQFVNHTFDIINTNKDYVQAAVFTFGREDLIPNMFLSIVSDIEQKMPEHISIFKYYLERHIEVDGDHHSHLALEMTTQLCGDDEQRWKEAEEAVVESLKKRIALWDGVFDRISVTA